MKSLSSDQKEQILIYPYETGYVIMNEYFDGVNTTLEALGYKDRVRYDKNKEAYKWSSVYDN